MTELHQPQSEAGGSKRQDPAVGSDSALRIFATVQLIGWVYKAARFFLELSEKEQPRYTKLALYPVVTVLICCYYILDLLFFSFLVPFQPLGSGHIPIVSFSRDHFSIWPVSRFVFIHGTMKVRFFAVVSSLLTGAYVFLLRSLAIGEQHMYRRLSTFAERMKTLQGKTILVKELEALNLLLLEETVSRRFEFLRSGAAGLRAIFLMDSPETWSRTMCNLLRRG